MSFVQLRPPFVRVELMVALEMDYRCIGEFKNKGKCDTNTSSRYYCGGRPTLQDLFRNTILRKTGVVHSYERRGENA